MKKASLLIALAGIGYLAWTLLGAESDAVRVYREFAEARALDRLDAALEMTAEGSEARRMIESRLEQRRRGLPAGITYAVTGVSFNVTSEKAADGGSTIILRAEQTTRVTGAGQESAFGRPVLADHEITLKIEGSRWKVASFRETIR